MKSLKIKLILSFVVLIIFGAFLSGFIIYSSYVNKMDDYVTDKLASAVYSAELAVDFTKSGELFQERAEESTYYIDGLDKLYRLNESLGMEYIYNISSDGNGWFFLFDSGNVEETEDNTFLYELEEMYEGAAIAIERKELYVEEEYSSDEWGIFRSAFLPVFDDSGKLITVIGADIEVSENQTLKRKILILYFSSILMAALFSGGVSIVIAGRIINPIIQTRDSLEDIASGHGDLSKRLSKKTNDELGQMVDSYNHFQDTLNSMLGKIVTSVESLNESGEDISLSMADSANSVEEISANITSIKKQVENQTKSAGDSSAAVEQIHVGIDKLGDIIEEQASGITESSAAIEQMVGNITAVSGNMEKLSGLFTELGYLSDEGKIKIGDVHGRVNNISSQSESLLQANTIISNIASQTNLLAMNAAIEAAHAGESGKGFSVVADEIRKLAEQSSSQSKTISQSLKGVLESISAVVRATSETEETFEKVIDHIRIISPLENQVKDALSEQKSGSDQILEALASMKIITESVREGSLEMKNSSNLLNMEMKKLKEISNKVNEGMFEIESGAIGVQEATVVAKHLVLQNKSYIEEVKNETGKFKLRE